MTFRHLSTLILLIMCGTSPCWSQHAAARCDVSQHRQQATEMAQELEQLMTSWAQQSDGFLASLPEEEATPLPPEPTHTNDTIIESTRGLFFDAEQSTLNYFGKVRLRDPRLHLDCERLFLQLEQKRVHEKGGKMSQQVDKPQELDLTPSKSAQEKSIMDESKGFDAPLIMDAQQVLIDMSHKRIYAQGEQVCITHSKGEMRAKGGQPIALIADEQGLIYMRGEHIEGFTINEQGERCSFSTQGYALFILKDDSLILSHNNIVQTAQAELRCQGPLIIQLLAKEEQAPRDEKSLQLNRAYLGIAHVQAQEQVYLKGKTQRGEEFELAGDALSYNAQSGDIRLSGDDCRLTHGEQNMRARGDAQEAALVHLAPDGSVEVRGRDIQGDYKRPSNTSGKMLSGHFQTQGQLRMPASDGKLYLSEGLKAQDEELDFQCSRELIISFEHREQKGDLQEKTRAVVLPQMPFTSIMGIAHVTAAGEVQAKGQGEFNFHLQGEQLEADLIQGTTCIIAGAQQWAQLSYDGSELKARSQDGPSQLELKPNGDILVLGERIEAYTPSQGGRQSMRFETEQSLNFNRNEGLITIEHPVRLSTEQGIFSSQLGLHAQLRRAPQSDQELTAIDPDSERGRYAHLNYPFIGLERAYALGGCALQSTQLSMQCDGPMNITMAQEGQKGKDEMLQGLALAEASGAVRFVAKDAKGVLYRATGDKMVIDAISGIKQLTGSRVTLTSGKNQHEASGGGARVTVDAKNNVTIRGAKQTSVATDVQTQVKQNKDKGK